MSDATDARLGPRPVELYECGAGRFWMRERPDVRVIEADDALLLEAITGYRTLREHVTVLERRGFQELEPGDLAKRLSELRSKGLLSSAAELVESLPPDDGRRDPIVWTVWVTRGRPHLLERSIRSWLDGRHGAAVPRVAVLDDSPGDETRQAFSRLAVRGSWYAGRFEKRAFAEGIAARAVPPQVLEFALAPRPELGVPYGANRNASLLATVGEMLLSSDDDLVFETASPPDAAGGLSLDSRPDPAGISCYGDRGKLVESLRPGGDPWAGHEGLLGRGVAESLRAAPSAWELQNLGRDLALRVSRSRHSTVLTRSGLYGDSGLSGNAVLQLRGGSWRQVTASSEVYQAARSSREIARVVSRPTLCECGQLTGHHFGLDNREILPPFFPAGRREDSVFALTLRVTHPQALCGLTPVAVLHDPPPRPAAAAQQPPPQPLFADVLSLLILSCSFGPAARDPAERMRALAAHLAGMASLENAELEKWVRAQWVTHWASEMALCEQRIVEGPRGAPWVRDCAARLEQIEAHIEGGAAVWPRDLGGGDAAAAWREAGDRIRRFAELLEWWPAIVAAARELKEAGRGLLQPLGRRP